MKSWIVAFIIDNFTPLILTIGLGLIAGIIAKVNSSIRHTGELLIQWADAAADGKMSKEEWAAIKEQLWKIISPWRKTPEEFK